MLLMAMAVYMIVFLALKWNEKHLRMAPANDATGGSTEPYQRME